MIQLHSAKERSRIRKISRSGVYQIGEIFPVLSYEAASDISQGVCAIADRKNVFRPSYGYELPDSPRVNAIWNNSGTNPDISPPVDRSRADPSARSHDTFHFPRKLIRILKMFKHPIRNNYIDGSWRKGESVTRVYDVPFVEEGMMINPVIHVYANHLGDLALKLLNSLPVSGIRHIKLTATTSPVIEQSHINGKKSIDTRIELDCAVIARKASGCEFRAHGHQLRFQPYCRWRQTGVQVNWCPTLWRDVIVLRSVHYSDPLSTLTARLSFRLTIYPVFLRRRLARLMRWRRIQEMLHGALKIGFANIFGRTLSQ